MAEDNISVFQYTNKLHMYKKNVITTEPTLMLTANKKQFYHSINCEQSFSFLSCTKQKVTQHIQNFNIFTRE